MSEESRPTPSPAFEVVDTKTGHCYRIWADGRTEGFPEAQLVINRIPALLELGEFRKCLWI